jgi:DNA gyrase subunit A
MTKTKRRRLANAFSGKSRIIYIRFIKKDEDVELIAVTNINKVLVFNTSMVPKKTTKNSQGVTVVKSKKGSYVKSIVETTKTDIGNLDYYRVKNIPAIGAYLRNEDIKLKPLQNELFGASISEGEEG